VIETFSNQVRILFIASAGIASVSPRDMLFAEVKEQLDENTVMIWHFSVTHPAVPLKTKYTRATIYLRVFTLVGIGDETNLECIG